jgi:hypothetical protein
MLTHCRAGEYLAKHSSEARVEHFRSACPEDLSVVPVAAALPLGTPSFSVSAVVRSFDYRKIEPRLCMQKPAMTKILQFPRGGNSPTTSENSASDGSAMAPPQRKDTKAASFTKGMIKGLWLLTGLMWPLLRRVFALDLVFQFVRMLWHWNTPDLHAGWTFMLHFALFCTLYYFVAVYEPEGE